MSVDRGLNMLHVTGGHRYHSSMYKGRGAFLKSVRHRNNKKTLIKINFQLFSTFHIVYL